MSNLAILTVTNSAPFITTQPLSQKVKAGKQAKFTIFYTANPKATVQWQESSNKGKTFTNIVGANSTSLNFMAKALRNGHQFRVALTNKIHGKNVSITSHIAILTVL